MAAGIEPVSDPPQNGHVAATEMAANTHGCVDVAGVAGKNAYSGGGEAKSPLQAPLDEDIPW